jgi:hypothetical protein
MPLVFYDFAYVMLERPPYCNHDYKWYIEMVFDYRVSSCVSLSDHCGAKTKIVYCL